MTTNANLEWWRNAVVYQIYPKSFKASKDGACGDLNGILEKLDYLKLLGVDVLWLTPVYVSPGRDNGYDISDYYNIDPAYGSLTDMRALLAAAHQRGIKIIMDIVVNHTSTAHQWFQQALEGSTNPYYDYYIWRSGVGENPPNNWLSKFGGSAWQFSPATGKYYLHLFDTTQADLNWENPRLREDIYTMMRWWLAQGVDGFRLDVINLISKAQDFPDDSLAHPQADGRKFYTDGPKIHEYLQEMNREVLAGRPELLTVGEMSSTSLDNCILYTRSDRQELSMTFNFHHLKVDYAQGDKWSLMNYDFLKLKEILIYWQLGMQAGNGWNALFWSNHDQPRALSRFGSPTQHHYRSATMLATALHGLVGTPYIYQGEEIGMTNPQFSQIADYQDVESHNAYRMMCQERGYSSELALQILAQKSRDNARTPVQWDASHNAGFTRGNPWLKVADNYPQINVAQALADSSSIFYYYQRLIALRKEVAALVSGEIRFYLAEHPQLLVYSRHTVDETLLIFSNFSADDVAVDLADLAVFAADAPISCLISNFVAPEVPLQLTQLPPYGAIILRCCDVA